MPLDGPAVEQIADAALEECESEAYHTPIEGLDRYTPAPHRPPWPDWADTECDVWVRIEGTCRPVVPVDPPWAPRLGIQPTERTRRYLEVATCAHDTTTCGVSFQAGHHPRLLERWCRRGDQEFREPVERDEDEDDLLSIVDIDDDSARYASVMRLFARDIDPFFVEETCTEESQSSPEREEWKQVGFFGDPPWPIRYCFGSAGFRVTESFDDITPHRRVVGKTVDCRIPCVPGYREAKVDAERQLSGLFVKPGGAALELFRSEVACRAAGDPSDPDPSPFPSDLCSSLARRLR